MRNRLFLLFIASVTFLLYSCDAGLKGDPNENQPPKTFLTVDSVNLPEGQRLVSQINISWWGNDPDGYVVGYEFQIGDIQPDGWVYTTSTDSTFVLPIEEGNMDADVQFTVRAVDNEGAVDPDPPSIIFPIRNSPPSISFNLFQTPPDTTFRVASFGFTATDPDGDANLNRIEIALNDTTSWQVLEPDANFITIRIDDTVADPFADIFLGRSALTTDLQFDTILLDQENTFYARAIDNAGAISPLIEDTWFVKRQTSSILFLNDFFGTQTQSRLDFHRQLLAANGITEVDVMNISDGTATGGRRVQLSQAFPDRSLGAPTINKMLAEWDYIYWISDDLNRNIGYALELTLDFFDNGGKMFVNIPIRFIPDDNPLLEFLPFERVQPVPSGQQSFIIQNNAVVVPNESIPNPPFLQFRRNQLAVNPVVPFGETVPLFEAPFRTRNALGIISDYDGPKLIAATNPEESLLFFGVDLTEFTSDSELEELVRLLTIDILGFSQ